MPLEIAPETGSGHSIRNVCLSVVSCRSRALSRPALSCGSQQYIRWNCLRPLFVVSYTSVPKTLAPTMYHKKNPSRSDSLAADGLSEHLRLHYFHALFSHRRGRKRTHSTAYSIGLVQCNPDPRAHKTRTCSLLLWTNHNQACRAQDSQPSFIQHITARDMESKIDAEATNKGTLRRNTWFSVKGLHGQRA